MTSFVLISSMILTLIGISVSVWSFINTREKYYKEYMKRKGND